MGSPIIFAGTTAKLLKNNLDFGDTSASLADNQAAAVNVTGFLFDNAVVRSFESHVTIVRGATYSIYKLSGTQRAADWVLSQEFTGDDVGVIFSITTLGQLQYTSTSTGSGATAKFSSIVTKV